MQLVLKEYQRSDLSLSEIASSCDTSVNGLTIAIQNANQRIASSIGVRNALVADGSGITAQGVAGLLSLTGNIELEIIPKFLSNEDDWRYDFLIFLARSRWGAVLQREEIKAGLAYTSGLNDLVAYSFLAMYKSVKHHPIRLYKRNMVEQFEIDGALDEESLILPSSNGFLQEVTDLSKMNVFNEVFLSAAKILFRSSEEVSIKQEISGIIRNFGPQECTQKNPPQHVPSRYREWETLYQLCKGVVAGLDIKFASPAQVSVPGFIVDTARAWEDLVFHALKKGLAGYRVEKTGFNLGERIAEPDGRSVPLQTIPDASIFRGNDVVCIADAKYKSADGKMSISNADVYEGYAFMTSTGIDTLLLFYPLSAGVVLEKNGVYPFEDVDINGKTIRGLMINPSSIGSSAGYLKFSQLISEYAMHYIDIS